MNYFVYVLYSLKDQRLYKGFTSDISARFKKHNQGGSTSTAKRHPFVIVHLEGFEDKTQALKRESYLKTYEGSQELKEILKRNHLINDDGKLNCSW